MKIAKLSLVAAVAVAGFTTIASADSLSEAFANTKVKGEIKSQYFQKEVADKKVSIWTNGGNLSLTTGSFNGLSARATFQVASVTASDLDNAATAYNSDQNVSGAVLSEAYLAYTRGNTSAKVGRQFISTPLVAGSGSRIFKESFEGITVVNTDIPNTTLVAAYVDKYQYRTDIASGGTTVKEVSDFEQVGDGAYTVYVKNNSVKNLTLEAQYAQIMDYNNTTNNDVKAFYANASYNLNPITISAQTSKTDNGNATNSDAKTYGVKVNGSIDKLALAAAYTRVTDDADAVLGLGNGADYLYTASWIYGGIYAADTDSYLLSSSYSVNDDLSLEAIYESWKTGNAQRASETDLIANYSFNKNLSTTFLIALYDKLADESYQSRLYISYKF